jgi:hypothetical protein
MKTIAKLLFAVALLGFMASARADILELKNGQTMSGKYAGGTPDMIYFKTDMGQMMVDVSNVVALTMVVPAPAAAVPKPAPVAAAPSAAPQSVTIPAGTVLMVKMMDSVSSKSAPGTPFTTKLEYDLAVNGVVAVKAGTVIYGKVQSSSQAKRARGMSTLDVRLVQMVPSGTPIPLSTTSYLQKGENETKKTVVAAGVGAVVGNNYGDGGRSAEGAAWGVAAASLKPGQTLTIPPGALVEFSLTQPLTVQIKG